MVKFLNPIPYDSLKTGVYGFSRSENGEHGAILWSTLYVHLLRFIQELYSIFHQFQSHLHDSLGSGKDLFFQGMGIGDALFCTYPSILELQ